jgi:hypothetical protein
MSIRGVFQLQKLTVSHCFESGSSRGIRAFIEKGLLADFAARHPHVEVRGWFCYRVVCGLLLLHHSRASDGPSYPSQLCKERKIGVCTRAYKSSRPPARPPHERCLALSLSLSSFPLPLSLPSKKYTWLLGLYFHHSRGCRMGCNSRWSAAVRAAVCLALPAAIHHRHRRAIFAIKAFERPIHSPLDQPAVIKSIEPCFCVFGFCDHII